MEQKHPLTRVLTLGIICFAPGIVFGRFLEVDPKREFHNPYSYVGNNPVNGTDPTGESTEDVHAAHTRSVLQNRAFSKGEIDIIIRVNLRSDNFFLYRIYTPNHATSLFLSDEAAHRRGLRFVVRKVNRAIRLANKGKRKKALKSLGRALHAAEDAIAHRHLGNVSFTLLQKMFGNGERWAIHHEQDRSVEVTKVDDPAYAKYFRTEDGNKIVHDEAGHKDIEKITGFIVDHFIKETEGAFPTSPPPPRDSRHE